MKQRKMIYNNDDITEKVKLIRKENIEGNECIYSKSFFWSTRCFSKHPDFIFTTSSEPGGDTIRDVKK